MQSLYVHVLLLDEDYGNAQDYAPKLCHSIEQRGSGGVCCLLGAVDANLIRHLVVGLPQHFTCFFRKRDTNRGAIVVAIASVILTSVTCVALSILFAMSGLAAELQLVCWLNPFAVSIGLLNTYVIASILLKTRIGKHWAFALENNAAFCADRTTLDYWQLSKCQPSRIFRNGGETFTYFSVIRFRTRWSGCMCKLVVFRLPCIRNAAFLCSYTVALIGDAVQMAHAHAASRRAVAIIVLVLPRLTTAEHVRQIREALTSANMWSECTQARRILVAAAITTHTRWEHNTHDWCHVVSLSETESIVQFEFKLSVHQYTLDTR